MTSAIANLDAGRIQAVAQDWVDSAELHLDGWQVKDAAEFIPLLQAHAQKAVASASTMYLWMCL